MPTAKRASMREGPLSALFRKTAEDTAPAEEPQPAAAPEPAAQVARINAFFGGRLDEPRMIAAVDPSLYRNRKGETAG